MLAMKLAKDTHHPELFMARACESLRTNTVAERNMSCDMFIDLPVATRNAALSFIVHRCFDERARNGALRRWRTTSSH